MKQETVMTEEMRNERLAECAKTVLNFCRSRTDNPYDAEELAQEILYEILRSAPNLRENEAFYGFLWRVADNICKSHYRKKQKQQTEPISEEFPDENAIESLENTENEDILLLRRELMLLSQRYRCAAILYYVENKSCAEIASALETSESMVKYLLFKSRKKLKEGMKMERNYGIQSYHPKKLHLCFLGRGTNHYYDLTKDDLIRQNILWACYNDELREEQIALEIGVGLPYIEKDIDILTEYKLLVKIGKKYRTNIVILTSETVKSIKNACFSTILQVTRELSDEIEDILPKMREIGFFGSNFSKNTLKWNLFHRILHLAYMRTRTPISADSPFENGAYVWGMEELEASINTCGFDAEGVNLCFYDYLPKPNANHHDFWNHSSRACLLGALAKNESEKIAVYGQETLADLLRLGYVVKKDASYFPAMCVFTQKQLENLDFLLENAVKTANFAAAEILQTIETILTEQTMAHLKEQLPGIANAALFNPFVGATLKAAVEQGVLSTDYTPGEIATMYLVK